MTPSTELRERAAELHTAWRDAEDVIWEAEDAGIAGADLMALEEDADTKRSEYLAFTEEHSVPLLECVSGLHLRCVRTGIPLVISDEVEERENGELALLVREVA